MALCPFAVHELLPENSQQNRITPTTVICHRAVSSAKDLYGYWNSPGIVLESHFYISEDGTIYQYMDTNIRADANVDANAFAVSIETWDGGNTPDSDGWNAVQVFQLKRLIKWICDVHGIKKEPARTWNGGGIGGHNWFPEPWADGPRGCPGTERNRQLREDIIPAVASGLIEDEEDTNMIMLAKGDGTSDFDKAAIYWIAPTSRGLVKEYVASQALNAFFAAQGAKTVVMPQALLNGILNAGTDPIADVDEALLAQELARLGVAGATPAQVKEAVNAALAAGSSKFTPGS